MLRVYRKLGESVRDRFPFADFRGEPSDGPWCEAVRSADTPPAVSPVFDGHACTLRTRLSSHALAAKAAKTAPPWRKPSGWGTVATRGRRLSPLHDSASSCSTKL